MTQIRTHPSPSPAPRDPQPESPTAPRLCPALLPDERTPCARRLPPDTTFRFCAPHAREYHESYVAYKSRSATTAVLKRELQAALEPHADDIELSEQERERKRPVVIDRVAVAWLCGAEVGVAKECLARWWRAVSSEIEAREAHHRRFFPTDSASLSPFSVPVSPDGWGPSVSRLS